MAQRAKPAETPADDISQAIAVDMGQMEAVVAEAAAMTAPTTSRCVSERNRLQLRVNELEREHSDFSDRRALLRAQYEAADAALASHMVDISDALRLYRGGLQQDADE